MAQTSVEWLIDKVFDHTLHKDMGQIFTQARKMYKEERMYSEEEVNFIIAEVWNSYEDNEEDETFTQMRKRVLDQFKKQ